MPLAAVLLCLPGMVRAQGQAAPVTVPAGFTLPEGAGDRIYPQLGDAGLDVLHYDLSLTSDPRVDELSGRAVLTVTALRELAQVNLDFEGLTVTGAKIDGTPARHAQVGTKLLLRPVRPVPAGATFTVTVAYRGTPPLHLDPADGLRLGWITQAGGSYVLSEPDGSHTFFPCNDVPADGATYSVHLDVPEGFVGVAGGVPGDPVTAGGRTRASFELPFEIPTYAMTVHVGRLQVVSRPGFAGVTVRDVFPRDVDDAVRSSFGSPARMLEVLSGWFGPFPYPLYGVAVVNDPQIPALETATLSTFPARAQGERVAAHEMAHQWFGDSVRLADWSDVWLNEGFATYAEQLYLEAQGEDPGALPARWYGSLRNAPARGLVARSAPQLFDTSSYLRGALALHALRGAVGDGVFREVLRTYVTRFTGRAVRTADLLDVVRDVAGQAGTDAVTPWVVGPDLPPLPPAS